MANRIKRTPERGERLLRQLALGLSIGAACRSEGIVRNTYYEWRRLDPAFAADADAAIEEGTDRLEDALHRRAKSTDTVAAIFLLKARRPDKYRETVDHRHGGRDGDPVRHIHDVRLYDLSRFTAEQVTALDELAAAYDAGERVG